MSFLKKKTRFCSWWWSLPQYVSLAPLSVSPIHFSLAMPPFGSIPVRLCLYFSCSPPLPRFLSLSLFPSLSYSALRWVCSTFLYLPFSISLARHYFGSLPASPYVPLSLCLSRRLFVGLYHYPVSLFSLYTSLSRYHHPFYLCHPFYLSLLFSVSLHQSLYLSTGKEILERISTKFLN